MRIALVTLSTLIFSIPAFAIDFTSPYTSGKGLQDKWLHSDSDYIKKEMSREIGHYVDVPLDYNDSSAGKISIYYYTKKPFESAKPTVLFFQGGPGGSGRNDDQIEILSGWNVIYMDYRGDGFSYPEKSSQLAVTYYFRSNYIVRDAKAIVDALGLHRISIYGESYGTILATMYASSYPNDVQGVILEGTVFDGANLWNAKSTLDIIQRYFDALPINLKDKIISYSRLSGANPAWFSRLVQQSMYVNNFENSATEQLTDLFSQGEDEILALISQDQDKAMISADTDEFSAHFFAHIACKELNAIGEYSTFNMVFDSTGHLVRSRNEYFKQACDSLGITANDQNTYLASRFPIGLPVTYIQGENDGATAAPGAIAHYGSVPQGHAQLFLVKDGGHVAGSQILVNPDDIDEQQVVEQIFNFALNGKVLSQEEFTNLKGTKLVNWSMKAK